VTAAASLCGDTTLLINNAGIVRTGGFQGAPAHDDARAIFETNFFGLIRMGQLFGPILGRNGGGAVLNVLSVASWFNSSQMAAYAASKSAAWSYTNGLRNELLAQGTQVVGLHVGFMDTDMTSGFDVAKASPADVASQTLAGVEAGLSEVLADDITRKVKQGLSANPSLYLAPLQR
jgi:short-subunit dehydrogenase